MKYSTVKQQNAFPICGALALAYSVTLFLGLNPEAQNYDLSCLRQHIRYCLSNGDILPFPDEKCLGQNQSDHNNSEQCLMASYFRHQQLHQKIHAESYEQSP